MVKKGRVVTVDIDPWVTERTQRFLVEAGYTDVTVVTGDAEYAADQLGPFDVIIVTVGAGDCPWTELLAPGGRLVVPIIFKTTTRCVTFIRDGDKFTGQTPTVCGFVSMQGIGAPNNHEASLAEGGVSLTIDGSPALDAAALERALHTERKETWTGITIDSREPYDTLNLWILTEDDRFGIIFRDPAKGVRPAALWHCPALITPDSFAYLASREANRDDEAGKVRHEFGIYGHGPSAAQLVQDMHDHVLTWHRERRDGPGPEFTLYPREASVPEPTVGRVFMKRHTQLLLQWPT